MASTDKSKVKITESSKQANVDITSETIVLPADSADQVLVAKVPSAANCTSGVNVEVEMSPDGTNWCPALRKEVVTTAGSSTAAIIGNEKYVDLQKKAPVYNSYAKGGLNFDTSGNTVALGTGTRDLLDQHIAVNKSFNHSMWIKSDTLPHIASDETVTYNVTVAGGKFYINNNLQASVYLREGSTYTFDQSDSSNSGHPLKLSVTPNGTHGGGVEYTTGVTIVGTPGTSGAYTRIVVPKNTVDLYYYCANHSQMGGNAYTPISTDYKPVLFRHGGYDNFENTKTITLTDTGAGSTDIANLKDSMNLSYEWQKVITSGLRPQDSFTVAYWVDASKLDAATTHYPGFANTENNSNGDFGINAADIIYSNASGSFSNRYYVSMHWRLGPQAANQLDYFTVDRNEAYLVIKRVDASGGNGYTGYIYLDVLKQSDGSSVFNQQATYTIDTSYSAQFGAFNSAVWDAQSGAGKIDELIMLNNFTTDANLNTLYQTINSKIYPKDFSSTSGALAWYRFGDVGTDSKALVDSAVSSSFGKLENTNFTSSDAIPALATTDKLYMAGSIKTTQNLTVPKPYINRYDGYMSPNLTSTVSELSYDFLYTLAPNKEWTWISLDDGVSTGSATANDGPSSWNSNFDTISFRFKGPNVTGRYVNDRLYVSSGFTGYVSGTSAAATALGSMVSGTTYTVYPNATPAASIKYISPSEIDQALIMVATNTFDSSTSIATMTVRCYNKQTGSLIHSRVFTTNAMTTDQIGFFDGTATVNLSTLGWNTNSNYLSWVPLSMDGVHNLILNKHLPDQTAINNYVVASADGGIDIIQDTSGDSDVIGHYKMGNGVNDSVTGTLTTKNEAGATTAFPDFTMYSVRDIQGSTDPHDDGLATQTPALNDVFNMSSNLSISGWFKTTDTGILFSNTGGAAATGMSCEITNSSIGIKFQDGVPSPIVPMTDVNDGEWHHVVVTKNTSQEFKIYIDGNLKLTQTPSGITNADLNGSNGFTLLGDGQNNAHITSPSATDISKLNATLSNWSIHNEVLDVNAVAQLYSNGHVRNIKNLPSVNANSIKGWWQLNNQSNPLQDSVSTNNLIYQSAAGYPANDKYVYDAYRGVVTLTTSPVIGNYNKDCSSDNIGFFPSLESSGNARSSNNVSYSFWYKPDSTVPSNGTYNVFWSERYVGSSTTYADYFEAYYERFSGNDYLLLVRKDYNATGIDQTRYWNLGSTGLLGDDTWRHFTITTTSADIVSGALLYIDGVLYDQASSTYTNASAVTMTATKSIHLGGSRQEPNVGENDYKSWTASGNPSAGKFEMDQFLTWNKVLSQTEVRELIGLDSSGAGTLTGTHPDNHSAKNNIERWFDMGGPSDGVDLYDSKNSSYKLTSYDNNDNITNLSNTDAPYYVSSLPSITSELIDATGATLVEKSINGNAITLSITKSFNFTTSKWVSDASGDAALCLSLNGFEEQAEYFALWKCSQTLPDGPVDICDGNWHNIALSYRGQNDLSGDNVAEGDVVRFGVGSGNNPFNFSLAIDGYPLYTEIGNNTGADYIGGLNTLTTDTISGITYNVGFNIYNRHLRYEPSNTEEEYRVHGQFGPAVHTYVANENDPHSFRGEVDETSFHSDSWWANSDGTNIGLSGSISSKRGNLFNQEKTYTLYGRSGALDTRGPNKTPYAQGIPYPLLNPELLKSSGNISDIIATNQFLNPIRKGDTQPWDNQVSTGGLEGWWRWGDTPGDCSITVNDVKDHTQTPPQNFRDIDAVYLTDQGISSNVVLSSVTNESIYLQSQAAQQGSGSASTQFNQIKLENLSSLIGQAACTVKDFVSPVLQYIRIKLTGSGTCDIGEGKLEIEINHKKRRMK